MVERDDGDVGRSSGFSRKEFKSGGRASVILVGGGFALHPRSFVTKFVNLFNNKYSHKTRFGEYSQILEYPLSDLRVSISNPVA